ncbi:MAG: hypothetical protein QOC62_3088 [Mycobacterium sp.]|nr:hypothetical protein [Mycobacterium sp.]
MGIDIAEPVHVAAQCLDRQLEFGLQPPLSRMDLFTGNGARLHRRAAPVYRDWLSVVTGPLYLVTGGRQRQLRVDRQGEDA